MPGRRRRGKRRFVDAVKEDMHVGVTVEDARDRVR